MKTKNNEEHLLENDFTSEKENYHNNSYSNSNRIELNPSLMKKPWVALFLSIFVVGLGHIYAGNVRKGIYLYLGFLLLVMSFHFICLTFAIFVVIAITTAIIYLYSLSNAYFTVKTNPYITKRWIDKWYFFILIYSFQIIVLTSFSGKILKNLSLINYYSMSSEAMSPTIEKGDYIASRTTKKINLKEVIICKKPENEYETIVFRCMGLPGDTIEIKDNLVYKKEEVIDNTNAIKSLYKIITNGERINSRFFTKYNIKDSWVNNNHDYFMYLTESVANDISKISIVKQISKSSNMNPRQLFPKSSFMGWTVNNYGPIYIPRSGDQIKLTINNINIYSSLILNENINNCRITPSYIVINDSIISDYTFKSDYFFVLGDNRDNALDSRYLGFIRKDNVIAKALYIYWSKQRNRIGNKI